VIRRLPSRSLFAVGAVATAMSLASCATFSSDAASVGDVSLSNDAFQSVLEGVETSPGFEAFVVSPGVVDADFVRSLLTRWITAQALGSALDATGDSVDDADRSRAEAELAAANAGIWESASAGLQNLFIDSLAAYQAFQDASLPEDSELRDLYDAGIGASGVACTRHILVDTLEDAQGVLADLAAGAEFADLAVERSTDVVSGAQGGILEPGPGAGCFSLDEFAGTLIPEFVQAAAAATVGEPTAPVQSQFGWHVILVRPYDEVAEAMATILGPQFAQAGATAIVAQADVSVASRYGRFDPASGTVVAVAG
jgi:hypothetical protein